MNNATLIIDNPDKSGNLLYATGYYCIDPIIYLGLPNKTYGFFPATEFEHAKQTARVDEKLDLTECLKQSMACGKNENKLKAGCVIDILRNNNISQIDVPEDFPIIEADFLRANGFSLNVIAEPFFKSRAIKTETEQAYIRENSKLNSAVMAKVQHILECSTVNENNILIYDNEKLTSEKLQTIIAQEFVAHKLWSDASIVAIGDQACMPHEHGSGYVYAGQSIVVDIFPKSLDNYYFSDMTRTFCKWHASDELTKLYNTVLEAQLFTLDSIRACESGNELHQKIKDFFVSKNYPTGVIDGFTQGFFHGTGHGVGIDCHEYPYISQNGSFLKENHVVTVEPGLYYKGIGGVRIEDLVIVKKDGIENLTNYEKKLIIE